MGDPRRIRKKYSKPRHPWESERIETEKQLTYDYGLTNKKEIWRVNTKLKSYREQAKKLSALSTTQAEKETTQLLDSLKSYGILEDKATLGSVLDIPVTSLMERRLQTVVVKQKLARTPKQARQLIVHGHITLNGKKITAPSFLVRVKDEDSIAYAANSKFDSEEHPERAVMLLPKKEKKPVKKVEVRRGGRRPPRRVPQRAPPQGEKK